MKKNYRPARFTLILCLTLLALAAGCSKPKAADAGASAAPAPEAAAAAPAPTPALAVQPEPAAAPSSARSAAPAAAVPAEMAQPEPAQPEEPPPPSPPPAAPQPPEPKAYDATVLLASAASARSEEELAGIEAQIVEAQAEGSLDTVIAALELAAAKPAAPPGIKLALSMAYGRKGLIEKSYAAVEAAEVAAKAPGIVFALSAVYGRKALLASDPRSGVGILKLTTEPPGALVRVGGRELGATPVELILPSAEAHDISLRLEGHEELRERVTLEAAKVSTIARSLKLIPASLSATSEPAGASLFIDGSELGRVPINVKVEPNKEHRLELRMANHASYFELIKLGPGQAKTISATLSANPGSLYVETDPPGAEIVVDDSEYFKTPYLMANLAAGQHQLTFRDFLIGKNYVSADAKTVTIEPGQRLSLKEKLTVKDALFRIKGMETGSKLSIDGANCALSDTGTGSLAFEKQMPAGIKEVRIERGQKVWSGTIGLSSKVRYDYTLSYFSWYYTLARRTIKIDGKDDDWAGLERIFAPSGFTKTPKVSGSQIAGGMMCRDDKNIYIKIEFANGKPALSKGTYRSFRFGPRTEVAMEVGVWSDGTAHAAIWDDISKSTNEVGSYAAGVSFVELRLPISFLPKRLDLSTPLNSSLTFHLSTNSDSDWEKSANYTPQIKVLIGT